MNIQSLHNSNCFTGEKHVFDTMMFGPETEIVARASVTGSQGYYYVGGFKVPSTGPVMEIQT